jgi:hypothetical protein
VFGWGKNKWERDLPHWDSVLVSVVDRATGTVTEMEGPPFLPGQIAESKAFWTPVLHEAREHLRKRGLEDVMMLGLVWDHIPCKEAVQMLHGVLPDARWVKHGHGAGSALHGVRIGYGAKVWGNRGPVDPSVRRQYGWKRGRDIGNAEVQFDRPRPPYGWPLRYFRLLGEWNIAGNQRGYGRKGADFWPVLKEVRGYPVPDRLSSGRYSLSDWGNRNIYQPDWLAPGPDGAISTVCFEMAREGIQECEARIFLERVLTTKAQRARIGEDLARRCQDLLDQRTRYIIWAGLARYASPLWYPASGWQERSRELFAAAAEVADALD